MLLSDRKNQNLLYNTCPKCKQNVKELAKVAKLSYIFRWLRNEHTMQFQNMVVNFFNTYTTGLEYHRE